MPLQLKSINKDFDISTGHSREKVTTQKGLKLPKRPIKIEKENERVKRKRLSTRSLSDSSTSVESNIISIYSDSERDDVVNEDLSSDHDDNLQVEYGVTKVQLHTMYTRTKKLTG